MILAYRLLLGLGFGILVADQVTKAWVRATIPFDTYIGYDSIEIIPGYFYFVHVGNWGAAWGQFEGFGWLFSILAVLAIFAIGYFRKHLELHRPWIQVIFGLICGGIIGNLIDRVWQGFVTDFILNVIPIIGYHWPVYNIADSAIVIGVTLYAIESIRADFQDRKKKPQGSTKS
ncbi:MAG: signal peptidase II [Verrucomicrobiota bacterium]